MKKVILLLCASVFIHSITNAQTNTFPKTGSAGIGTLSPDASSLLEIVSTTKGILISRMTKNQRDAIVSPVEGLLIYQTNGSPGFYYYSGSDWKAISPKGVNKSLSNLTAPTAVNVNLLPGTAGTLDMGSAANAWKDVYLNGSLYLGGVRFLAHQTGSGTDNTAVGKDVLYANTTGNANTGTGFNVLHSNTTGSYNTGSGYNALYTNTSGAYNIAAGASALYANVTGGSNIAIGRNAMNNNINGNSNIAIGNRALYNNTIRSSIVAIGDSALFNNGLGSIYSFQATANTAIGSKALLANTTGRSNTATGSLALNANTTGFGNTASGDQALEANDTGYYNTGIGYVALTSNAGDENTATGALALVANTSGDLNLADGSQALAYNITGSANTATGSRSVLSNTTGSYNTGIGNNALYGNTTGSGNTGVGKGAGSANDNNSYCTFLGYDADQSVSTNFTNSMALGNTSRITASNQVRIGNGSITSIGGYAGWSNISDGRVKKNIKENVPGLQFINQLKAITYNLQVAEIDHFLGEEKNVDKNSEASSLLQESVAAKEKIVYTGFIAQDVEAIAKKMNYDFSGVDKPQDESGLYGLRYAEFVVPLVKAVQELSKENDELKKRLEKIETLLAANSNVSANVQSGGYLATGASSLEQNIPNPFTSTTTIHYMLPQKYRSAKMIITDNGGKTLKEINLPAGRQGISGSGKGNINIDASAFSSGIYQYSLLVDGKVIMSKQMVVSR